MPEISDIDLHDVCPTGIYVDKQALQEDTCNIYPFKDGGVAFIIDGNAPNQIARMVDISQIIDNTAIVKCHPGGGIAIRKLDNLFRSKNDAEQAILIQTEEIRQRYADQITDIDALVRFMLTHDITTDTHDKLVRMVVIERAKELGINLQDIEK